jgi:phage terminase large subunit-like protein
MFKRMYLGIITSSAESWLMSETLDAQASTEGPPEAGRTFVGGLDLSSIRDLTAFIQWFQDDDGDGGEIVARFYMPRENLQARVDEDRVPYDVWADDGWITLTDGRTVDYEFIIRDIEEQCEVYPARSFGIDPWNGQQVRTALESAGFLVVKVPQSHIRLDSCVNEGERLLQNGRVRGFHNPVLRWMFLNAVVNMNAHKLRKLDKLASPEKIDGAVAWLNALSEAMGVEADETMGAGWL